MDPVEKVDISGKSPLHWLMLLGVNLLVLAELCLAMYLASRVPDDFTPTFLKTFFGLLIPTLIVAFVAKRLLRPVEQPTKP